MCRLEANPKWGSNMHKNSAWNTDQQNCNVGTTKPVWWNDNKNKASKDLDSIFLVVSLYYIDLCKPVVISLSLLDHIKF